MSYTSWFFDKIDFKRTPSVLDGISVEEEARYRREGARFINKVGTRMNLRYDTMATGVAYFHRFYMCHSFKQFPRYVTACCCLFLAGKVEETPKKCKDIIKTAKFFITEAQFAKFGEDPKEEVLTLERILLQTINFDLQVDHPYDYLLKYAKVLKGDREKIQKLVQMAWTFINDSMCTTISLQWEPEVIAIALMFLAGKLTKFEVVDWEGKTKNHQKWWDMFVEDISTDLLEDICHQVLDLYSMPMPESPQDSPSSSPNQINQVKLDAPPINNQTNVANVINVNSTNLTHPSSLIPPNVIQPLVLPPNAFPPTSIPPKLLNSQQPTIPILHSVPHIQPPILPPHVSNQLQTGPPIQPPPFYRPPPFQPTNHQISTGPPILPTAVNNNGHPPFQM